MKILFYNSKIYLHAQDSLNASGGAERQQWLLARALAKRGHEVVVAIETTNPDILLSHVEGVRFLPCKPRRGLFFLRNLCQLLTKERPDWYYHRVQTHYLGIMFFMAKRLGIRTVFASAIDRDCQPHRALVQKAYLWWLYAWGLNEATRIIVQHLGQMQLLSPGRRQKAYLVNNAVELPDRDQIALSDCEAPYIGWVGSLRIQKRPHLLVEIARALPEFLFVVVGPISNFGSRAGYSEDVATTLDELPNVDYRGAIQPSEVIKVIANAKVFLSTSFEEGFPNTMLEAWSVGVPVVSLEVDPGDLIKTHELGKVTVSVEETVQELIRLLTDDTERKRLGFNGLRHVQCFHSPDYVCKQLEAALS